MSSAVLRNSSSASLDASSDVPSFTRLHITPFDSELLKVVLPASVLPSARNVSFHTIETFPEKRFGFVDLPHMEAEKLKKKLNGATLKGTKVRIEKARSEDSQRPGDAEAKPGKRKKHKVEQVVEDGKKKRKRDYDILEGITLGDRKVKRGWTETPEEAAKKPKRTRKSKDKTKEANEKSNDKSEKKRVKSKYTDGAECLLNTKIPANAVKLAATPDSSSKRRKKDRSRQVVVHEFEKTTKFPSFLKASSSDKDGPLAAEFVEGKGWVDQDGAIVEAVKGNPKFTSRPLTTKSKSRPSAQPAAASAASDSVDSDDSTSSSGSSSEDDTSDSSGEEESLPASQTTPDPSAKTDGARPMSSSSSRSLTIKIPPPITPSAAKVHPLEALYKRTKPDENPAETPAQTQPFSFFGGGNDTDIEDDGEPSPQPTMPMTPFTRQDLEWRTVRSAAPTPDTAHPSRVRNFWATVAENGDEVARLDGNSEAEDEATREGQEGEEEEEEEEEPGNSTSRAAGQTSEFQDWFWENRRELNRSWMKRRKVSAKEKRHRDNKVRASRVF